MASRILSLVALLVLATPAAANSSAYTPLALDKCRALPTDPDDPLAGGAWLCTGYRGIVVRVEENDERVYVSYGPHAADEPAASETLPAFNDVGETIEWRLDGSGRPFATIFRFHTGSEDNRGSSLVVTRLAPPGHVCRVGIVDAVANPDANANAIARAVADRFAAGYACSGSDAPAYGIGGRPIQP